MGTFYDDLGVKSSATAEEIEAAYRWLVQKFHPDKNPGREDDAAAHFMRIQRAYDVLSDPAARTKYDESLAGGKSTATGGARRDERPKPKRRLSATIPYFIAAGFILLIVVAAILNLRKPGQVMLRQETESQPVAPPRKAAEPPNANVTRPPLVAEKVNELGDSSPVEKAKIPKRIPRLNSPQVNRPAEPPKSAGEIKEPNARPETARIPPEPEREPEPETSPGPVEPEQTVSELPKKLPVPDDKSQQAARGRISITYSMGLAKSAAEKSNLAQSLLEVAVAEQDSSVRFMLQQMSEEFFVEAGNCDGAWSAIDGMEIRFEIDGLAKKRAALSSIVSASKKTPAQVKYWVQRWLELTRLAAELERFEDAVGSAEQAAKLAKNTPNEIVQRIAKRTLDHTQELKIAFGTASSDLAKPNSDATAAAIWGKFLCMYRNRWHEGLSLWSRGEGDDSLTAIAKRDFADPKSTEDQMGVADAWFDAAEKELDDLSKESLRSRALYWYRFVTPRIAGVNAVNVEAKIQKIMRAASLFPTNELVNLLGMVETESPTPNGAWERRADRALTGTGVVELPVIARGSYELEVVFSWTRPKSPDPRSLTIREFDVAQITFPIDDRAVTVTLPEMTLQTGQGSVPTIKHEKPSFRANHQYKFKIKVDTLAGELIRVDGSVDGKNCLRWEGQLEEPRGRSATANKELAIRLKASLKPTTIHSVKLRMLSGTASLPDIPNSNGAQ